MNNENWVKVYTTNQPFRAEIVKGFLIENEIDAVILNQVDSSYQVYGTAKVMVQAENEQRALSLIAEVQNELEDES